MTDTTSLGDRMKAYEAPWKTTLPRRQPLMIRVDGRAFHSYLRSADKPFDMAFIDHMGQVAAALCTEISGAVFAYHQSDEISMLVCDYLSHNTEPWFGGELQKIVSLSAATATVTLARLREGMPTFDARAFVLPNEVEVANYFLWRQRDAVKNSIMMAARAHFSHKRLHGLHGGQLQELLFTERGVNWNDFPVSCKRGQVVTRHTGDREVTYVDKRSGQECSTTAMRTWWEVEGAPHFTLAPGDFLASTIPPVPTLGREVA